EMGGRGAGPQAESHAGFDELHRTGCREAFGGIGFIGHGSAPARQKVPSALKDFRLERQLA
ncbi:MAG: hypothetical protein RIQ68_1057, partial [Pseudomonadota bacterium]